MSICLYYFNTIAFLLLLHLKNSRITFLSAKVMLSYCSMCHTSPNNSKKFPLPSSTRLTMHWALCIVHVQEIKHSLVPYYLGIFAFVAMWKMYYVSKISLGVLGSIRFTTQKYWFCCLKLIPEKNPPPPTPLSTP